MELLIAVLLLSLLSVGIVLTLRVALSAMNKSGSKLMANRRVSSVERILDQEIEGIMPVTADCQAQADVPGPKLMFFQGETASMRLASTYSLQQGERGLPMILEFQVIPGEEGQGVRLVVNEHWYTGPRGAGVYCIGMGPPSDGGPPAPLFAPISIGPESFVIADKLAYCRFSFRDPRKPPEDADLGGTLGEAGASQRHSDRDGALDAGPGASGTRDVNHARSCDAPAFARGSL